MSVTDQIAVLLLLCLLVVPAVVLVRRGLRVLRRGYAAATTETVTAAAFEQHTPPAAVEGAVKTADDTVQAPLTETACVAYEYDAAVRSDIRTTARGHGPSPDDEGGWSFLDAGSDAVPFYIEDDTGHVRIDPQGAEFRFEQDAFRPVPWRSLPEPLREYIARHDQVADRESALRWLLTPAQRFREGRLEPGETASVRRQAPESESSTPRLVIADTDVDAQRSADVRSGLALLGAGAVLLLGGAVIAVGAW